LLAYVNVVQKYAAENSIRKYLPRFELDDPSDKQLVKMILYGLMQLLSGLRHIDKLQLDPDPSIGCCDHDSASVDHVDCFTAVRELAQARD
jgi:hypothetical protein